MSTVLTPVGNAIYKRVFESSSSSVLVSYDKQTESITLPYTISEAPRYSGDSSPYTLFAFLYNVPSELKYKKIKIKLTFNFSFSAPSGYAPFYGYFISSTYNTSESIFSSSIPIPNSNFNLPRSSRGFFVSDDNAATNTSHGMVVTYHYNSLGTSGTYSITQESTFITGPSNKLIIQVGTGPSYRYEGYNNYYSTCQMTLNSFSAEITEVENNLIIEPTYPIGVNIKNSSSNIFTWSLEDTASFSNVVDRELYNIPFQSVGISYRKQSASVLTQYVDSEINNYIEVAANTFDVSPYTYRPILIDLYNNEIGPDSFFDFNAIGANAAPTINSVTNDSLPLISWTDVNQEAYEVRVKDSNQNVIYYSGILAGNAQSYRLPQMLADGVYIVEVREINTFGYYSEWGSLEFTINPTAVSAPTDIFATTNNKYGVEISGTPVQTAQKTYVVRREVGSDEVEILGEYTGGIYTDYTAKGNTFYEYTLRNYNYAYNDGFWVPIQVKVKQVVIQDGRDKENYIPLHLSEKENFGPQWTEEADRTLFNCLGRRYPVKELGEWVNSIRTFSAFVFNSDIPKLLDMSLNAPKIYYMADKEYFACDMAIEDNGAYGLEGRIITFTITRIADDESVNIV